MKVFDLEKAHALDQALADVREEVVEAMAKFDPMHSPHEGYAVIKEEVDELWEQVKANFGTWHTAHDEARQIAAMAIRYMIDIPRPS